MEPSLTHATCLYPRQRGSIPHLKTIYLRCIFILSFYIRLHLSSGILPTCFLIQSLHATCPTQFIHSGLIILMSVRSTSYEAPHHTIFSSPLLIHTSYIQIFSSELFLNIINSMELNTTREATRC
jgi:hypothetical protein